MNTTTRLVSAVALGCLIVCAAMVSAPAAKEPSPVAYQTGKIGPDQYAKIGKGAIPFVKKGEKFFVNDYKTLGIYEFWVNFNVSDIHDEPDVKNEAWFVDVTLQIFNMVESMFKEMGFEVTDREALTAHESFAPVKDFAGEKGFFTRREFRGMEPIYKDGKYETNSSKMAIRAEMSFFKETAPGLLFFDLSSLEGKTRPKGGISAIKKAIETSKNMQESYKGVDQFYALAEEIGEKQGLDLVPRVHVSVGLNDEKKGTPETGMKIVFHKGRNAHPQADPNKKVKVTLNTKSSGPFTLESGRWYYKKVDNRIGGDGKDKKRLSGEKVKATTLEMFEHQCKTYAATYNMYKAKYEEKKK